MNQATAQHSSFWTSPETDEFIDTQMSEVGGHGPLNSAAWDWESLRDHIMHHNAVETFTDFRWGLFALVQLLRAWRDELERLHGVDCLIRVQAILRDDARAVAAIQFIRTLTAATRLDAVESLTRLGRSKKRIRYRLPAGGTNGIGGQDCGMGVLLEICGQVERTLASSNKVDDAAQGQAAPAEQCETVPRHTWVTIRLISP